MLESFTYETFAGREGERFLVHLGAGRTVTAQLEHATNWTRSAPPDEASHGHDAGETFSLVFRLPLEPMLPQATYIFQHDEIGTFPLFIVPVGRSAEGLEYEAVFNRPPRAAGDAP